MLFDIEGYPDARYQDEQTRWVVKDGKDVRQVYVSNQAGSGWVDRPYRLTFTENLTLDDVTLIVSALRWLAETSETSGEAAQDLADRLEAMELREVDHINLEVARASFMTKSHRIEELTELLAAINEQALPPSKYRQANQFAILGMCTIARTLVWKESK